MEPQETKFTFVYNELKQYILEGQVLPGNSLQSSRMLCSQFHVSRYTINRVLNALQEEGLIQLQPRLAPIVVSRKDTLKTSGACFDILKHKDSILQVYQTLALVMPSILVFSSQGCDIEIMPHYKKAMKVSRFGLSAGGWRPPANLGYDILRTSGNSLFGELYSTFGLYTKIAFFTEECPYFSKRFFQGSVSGTGTMIEALQGKNPSMKHKQLSDLYHRLANSIADTLEYLSDTMPMCPEQTGGLFAWNPLRGQDYYHSKIVDDLNRKIGLGEYPVGMYLPYEKQLARLYGVSLSTVRKALSELQQRGFVKTLNGKGTIVVEPDYTKIHQLALNSGYAEKAVRYLHALQLMVLIIYPAALEAAPRFTREELDKLADQFTSPGTVYLEDIFKAILEHTALEPLFIILSETNRLLEWGHHFAYYPSKRHTIPHLNKQVVTALLQLKDGNICSFADGMADCYRYILGRTKKHMVEKYKLNYAANIRIPEKY